VDGSEILHQLVVYPVIYWVLYIPGGAAVRMLVEMRLSYVDSSPASSSSTQPSVEVKDVLANHHQQHDDDDDYE